MFFHLHESGYRETGLIGAFLFLIYFIVRHEATKIKERNVDKTLNYLGFIRLSLPIKNLRVLRAFVVKKQYANIGNAPGSAFAGTTTNNFCNLKALSHV